MTSVVTSALTVHEISEALLVFPPWSWWGGLELTVAAGSFMAALQIALALNETDKKQVKYVSSFLKYTHKIA